MCGIAGFNWSDETLVKKMDKAVSHRGPDDVGIFVDEHFSIGHQRLSILDLSEQGHQPMRFKDLVITYNGEVYNYREIRDELKGLGYSFQSDTDTEVILAAFDQWGYECLKRFNGIFAFAIWDKKKKELFLARDHLGVKPLYYFWDGQKFIFASEIKALLECGIDKKVNTDSLNFLLRILYVPEPETMFEGINKLKAGYYAVLKDKNFEETKYWDIDNFSDLNKPLSEIKEDIHYLLKDSVKKQLISDRPLGVFLSGGWDSSTVLGLMRELGVKEIETFSSGFDTKQDKYNEDFRLARMTAEYYKTNHHEVTLPRGLVSEIFEDVVYHLDEPNAAPTTLPLYYLSKQTKEKVAVVLGGDGGDELFAGYPRYTQSFYLNKFQKLPKTIREYLFPYFLLESYTGKTDLKSKMNIPQGYERFAQFKVYPDEKTRKMLKREFYKESIVRKYFESNYFNQEIYPDFEKVLMYLDLKNWLAAESLWKSDRMTMAWGLEYRVPFLDPRLVELAFKTPTKHKVRNFAGKWVFKQVVKPYIPAHLRGKKKMGWLTPGNHWLQNELKPLVDSVVNLEYEPEIAEYFDMDYVKQLQEEHLAGNTYHLNQLWSVLTFAVWYRKFFK